jgi:alpha-L-fucosidase 2
MACLYARVYEADSAVKQLKIFTSIFVRRIVFHLNGDQNGGEYSNFTYRPFTLEGNFAFAKGVQELYCKAGMVIYKCFLRSFIMENVSFNNL